MKHLIYLLLTTIALTSCQQVDLTAEEDTTEQTSQARNIQFVIKGISVDYATRATLASEGITDLWVWEGTTLLKHQVSTDSDFGAPTVSLTVGAHDITFVASKSDGQNLTDGTWSCAKVKDTFAKVLPVTISSGSKSRQVELTRRSCLLRWTIEDAIPSAVSKMRISVNNRYSLTSDLTAGTATAYQNTVDITSKVGQTGVSPSISMFTLSPTDEEQVSATIEFLSSTDAVLYSNTMEVSMKTNRVTNIHGNFFQGDTNTISVNSTWLTQNDVSIN